MSNWKDNRKRGGYIKPIGSTLFVSGVGWLLFQVYATYNTLKTIGRIEMIHHGVKFITIDEHITKGLVKGPDGFLEPQLGRRRLGEWLNHSRFLIARHFLTVAQSADIQLRMWAVRKLTSIMKLSQSQSEMTQLAQACDPHTAVALARIPNINLRYFLPPPPLHNVTETVKQDNYLLDAEVMLTEPWQILTTQENILPLCIQALDHHISNINSEVDFIELNGLPLLMAVYQQYRDNKNVTKMICRILTRVCAHPEYLHKIHEAGWIGVLADWLGSDDFLLSLLAGQCLINLDRDEPTESNYGRNVVPLHPLYRSHPPLLDVVFVHGLLGGVFTTWRQRNKRDSLMVLQKDDMSVDTRRHRHSSDGNTEEYLAAVTALTQAEWEELGSDYEFVVSDFPVNCKSQDCDKWLTLSGAKSLRERATVVLSELKRCGVGQRPTVWVAHSMGGLLVKQMLTEAQNSPDHSIRSIAHNSEAIIFLSTPHLGCPLAKMNDILNYLLWPSTEVEELRHNSDVLSQLHQEFRELLRDVNIKIVTFAEAKSTRVSTLGVDFHIVPPEFSYIDVGDLYEMPCDHACVAKPYNRLSFIYQTVLNVIKSIKEECLDNQQSD